MKKRVVLLSVFFCLLPVIPLFAEEIVPSNETNTTTSNNQRAYLFDKPLDLNATFSFPSYVFSLSTTIGGATPKKVNVDYSPPPATELSLGFSYNNFGFSWSRPLPQSKSNRDTYGKTDYNDWRFEYGVSKFALSVFHQKYKNFYTDTNGKSDRFVRTDIGDSATDDENDSLESTYKPNSIIKRPDIHTQHSAAIFYYAYPLLSEYPEAFLLSFRSNAEKASEGFDLNWVSDASINHSQIESTYSLIPQSQTQKFKDSKDLIGTESYAIGLATGLASSYVFTNSSFSFYGALLIGATAQRQKTTFLQDQYWKNTMAAVTHFRGGLLREGQIHSFSLAMIVDNWSYKINSLRVNSSNLGLELGYSIKL